MTDNRKIQISRLRIIAELLGVSIERLSADDPTFFEKGDAGECLRLWSMIKTDSGRERALECLRQIADEEQG